ncbi:SAVED domain-containing protein [Kocuria rhizophila]|uniref:Hachiman antiphage defense system protein HamA n=1 Tax=Kocuria rhizophila TaxID=72000 RepID=UPI001FD7E304|nr:Hachiman antiphage defense system protein HamA [Kocuria rhizophila]MDN3227013.1 SAVED domain-containing protein [Kocuria rhizophila]
MAQLSSWTTSTHEPLKRHTLVHMVAPPATIGSGVDWAASQIPNQYTDPNRVATILAKLGKPKAAKYLKGKLPTSKRTRSGELGEIIGAQYATLELGFRMVERLRWKDHREMSMRGDDLIGVRASTNGTLELLKGEAKSRARLGTATVTDADDALKRDQGRPSPHALSFVADRLHELGEHTLAELIDDAQLISGISQPQVVQLLFTFTGNDPRALLRANTTAYRGRVKRLAVGLQVSKHQAFIAKVYSKAIADA